ncbi:TIR-NBS-LRR resistance protein [Quillaja saponaria]|uniref:TIR-NBS-LRR resistance protein n=1 Tax=Quillaja saponaria TaxID=32244 RepID=A0AAD7LFP7_QUISA|nr:TIR-NBS-LRR resistance protein [Quillaja saponaria]
MCSLKDLKMDYCSNLSEIPNEIDCLSSLRRLSLCGSNIATIPVGIKRLVNLVSLFLSDCKRLQSLLDLPPSLIYLEAIGCPSLTTVSSPRETISKPECLFFSYDDLRSFYYDCFTMDLSNCLNLDPNAYENIMEETRIAVMYCSVEKTLSKVIVKVPGSEIPKWFPYQSNGPSLTIEWIPPTSSMIQFILCAVLAVEERKRVNGLIYIWQTKIGDYLIKSSPNLFFENGEEGFYEKDHMIISWYDARLALNHNDDVISDSLLPYNSDAYHTFTILFEDQNETHDIIKVKVVGVNPIILS